VTGAPGDPLEQVMVPLGDGLEELVLLADVGVLALLPLRLRSRLEGVEAVAAVLLDDVREVVASWLLLRN